MAAITAITLSDPFLQCGSATLTWQGGVPPFRVQIFRQQNATALWEDAGYLWDVQETRTVEFTNTIPSGWLAWVTLVSHEGVYAQLTDGVLVGSSTDSSCLGPFEGDNPPGGPGFSWDGNGRTTTVVITLPGSTASASSPPNMSHNPSIDPNELSAVHKSLAVRTATLTSFFGVSLLSLAILGFFYLRLRRKAARLERSGHKARLVEWSESSRSSLWDDRHSQISIASSDEGRDWQRPWPVTGASAEGSSWRRFSTPQASTETDGDHFTSAQQVASPASLTPSPTSPVSSFSQPFSVSPTAPHTPTFEILRTPRPSLAPPFPTYRSDRSNVTVDIHAAPLDLGTLYVTNWNASGVGSVSEISTGRRGSVGYGSLRSQSE